MRLPGYAGNVLFVDLTSGRMREEALDPDMVRAFVGGWGINNRLAYDLIPPRVDPLSAENSIILGTGPFVGTLVPGGAKIFATTKFPLNNAFATAAGGGAFALYMKSAGYDHIVINGRAESPVYLKIAEGAVEICDAADLWRLDAVETVDELRSRHEPCSVVPIGPSGENLVPMAVTTIDKAGTLGRGGMPAVMGSKNLKALVAVRGARPIQVAHRVKLLKLVDGLSDRMMRWPGRQRLVESGMMEVREDLKAIHKRCRQPLTCPSCLLADKEIVRIDEGRFAGRVVYATHMYSPDWGSPDAVEEYNMEVRYLDAANRYGLDVQTLRPMVPFVARLYSEGIITREDTGGLEIKDDFDTTLRLMEMIAYREGFGEVLGHGIGEAARRIGRGAERFAEHVKNFGIVDDPRHRALGTMEFEEIVNPRGAHVASGGSPAYGLGRSLEEFARHADRMGAPAEAIPRLVEPTFHAGRYTRYSEDWFALFNCLGLCNRAQVNRFYSAASIAELYSAITGEQATREDMMRRAERAWMLGKLLNTRAGFSRKDDVPPQQWFQPLVEKGEERRMKDYFQTRDITPEDMERMLDDYYDERGYDRETGTPRRDKLEELGLPTS